MYNDDVREQDFPQPAQQFRHRIALADAMLIVSQDYSFDFRAAEERDRLGVAAAESVF
jgi:NAD(P)H-dependent FMN reductase